MRAKSAWAGFSRMFECPPDYDRWDHQADRFCTVEPCIAKANGRHRRNLVPACGKFGWSESREADIVIDLKFHSNVLPLGNPSFEMNENIEDGGSDAVGRVE